MEAPVTEVLYHLPDRSREQRPQRNMACPCMYTQLKNRAKLQVALNVLYVWILPNWAAASERKAFFPWLMAFGKQKEEKERIKMAQEKRIKGKY